MAKSLLLLKNQTEEPFYCQVNDDQQVPHSTNHPFLVVTTEAPRRKIILTLDQQEKLFAPLVEQLYRIEDRLIAMKAKLNEFQNRFFAALVAVVAVVIATAIIFRSI